MSIARLKKLSCVCKQGDTQTLLTGLQGLGCAHVIEQKSTAAQLKSSPASISKEWLDALTFLKADLSPRKQVRATKRFDAQATVDEVLTLKTNYRRSKDKIALLKNQINTLKPWGNFDLEAAQAITPLSLWFYMIPNRHTDVLKECHKPWRMVGKDHRFSYVVVISTEAPDAKLLPFERVDLGDVRLEKLEEQLLEAEIEYDDLVASRKSLTRYITLLEHSIAKALDISDLKHAQSHTLNCDGLAVLQAWVPEQDLPALREFAAANTIAISIAEPTPDEQPPTLLEQPESLGAGRDLAYFYDVPGYRSWDPTVVLLMSFTLFFGMIISDAGYGLVMLAALAIFWRKLSGTSQARAYRQLLVYLTGATITYGVIVGSYFGLTPPAASTLGTLKLISVDDFNTMMKLSVGIGVLHIVLANAMMAKSHRHNTGLVLAKIGWIALALGGYAYWLSAGQNTLQTLFGLVMIIGVVAIFLFSGASANSMGQRLFTGAQALGGIMGAFGDILSYMRLFALGLASASLALTFNNLASSAYDAYPGVGLLLAGLILILGHVLNFVLAVMSGVVHGLRLNFIEFYKWGLEGEGLPFKRFIRREE